MKELVKKSADISLKVQIIAGVLTYLGSNSKVQPKDKVLTELLKLETIVQVIEIVFYIWITRSMMVAEKVTPRRYIDWAVTTPTMLFTTIVYSRKILSKKFRHKPRTRRAQARTSPRKPRTTPHKEMFFRKL